MRRLRGCTWLLGDGSTFTVKTDDVRHYAFSNCFEIASKSKPYEKVVFGQNQIYVLETLRAEGTSPWYTCAHDEFALVMDGDVVSGLRERQLRVQQEPGNGIAQLALDRDNCGPHGERLLLFSAR